MTSIEDTITLPVEPTDEMIAVIRTTLEDWDNYTYPAIAMATYRAIVNAALEEQEQ